ncbi:MAG: hypothetical protein JW866_07495 [Ignavibacteriales bacterium]|nr:hypothetical protein [Ignavibacteriales bacterium]
MNSVDDSDKLIKQLELVIKSYLDIYTIQPSLETLHSDVLGQARVASLGAIICITVDFTIKYGCNIDEKYLSTLSKEDLQERIKILSKTIELAENSDSNDMNIFQEGIKFMHDGSTQKYLLNYFAREFNWIIVSLLSSSYISAFILMRSIFELIIGIATRTTGGMVDRIQSISCFNLEEQKNIKDLWYRLCAWAHPYGKWIKEICPIFIKYKPIYHPTLFLSCLNELTAIVDLFVVILMEKYKLNHKKLKKAYINGKIDLTNLLLFKSRA